MMNPKKILVVDDEKALAKVLSIKLRSEGFDVDTLNDGSEVMAFLKKTKYDLMLLDLVMPKMNGFEVLEQMNTAKIDIPVIALTNLSQNIDKERVKNLGVKDYFIKSNTPIVEVVNQVRKYL